MKILSLIIFAASAALSQAQDTLSLRAAVESALENNYSIKMIRKTGEIAENNVSYGNAGMLPRIDAVAGYNYNIADSEVEIDIGGGPGPDTGAPVVINTDGAVTETMNASIQMDWALFDGFNMFVNYSRLQAFEEKSDIEIQIAVENLIKNLYTTYLEGLRLQKNLDILEESIEISGERLVRVSNMEEFGAATSLNILQADVDLRADSSQYMQTRLALENIKRNINYMLGLDEFRDFYFEEDIIFKNLGALSELRDEIFNKNSSIMLALQEKEISDLDYETAMSFYYPRLNFSSSYGYNSQSSDGGFMKRNESLGFSAGLNASINLFDGMQSSIQRQNALIRIEMSEDKIADIRNMINLNLTNAYNTYQRRLEIYRMELDNLELAERNFTRSSEIYKLGQISSLEFRQAQINLTMAKFRAAAAAIDAKIAEYDVLMLGEGIF